jgi:hypothetical protein
MDNNSEDKMFEDDDEVGGFTNYNQSPNKLKRGGGHSKVIPVIHISNLDKNEGSNA